MPKQNKVWNVCRFSLLQLASVLWVTQMLPMKCNEFELFLRCYLYCLLRSIAIVLLHIYTFVPIRINGSEHCRDRIRSNEIGYHSTKPRGFPISGRGGYGQEKESGRSGTIQALQFHTYLPLCRSCWSSIDDTHCFQLHSSFSTHLPACFHVLNDTNLMPHKNPYCMYKTRTFSPKAV